MADHFADRVLAAIETKKTPVCVGIDPVYERLPGAIREHPDFNDGHNSEVALDAILEFSRRVIRLVGPIVPLVKINTAYFERFYGEGLEAYFELIQEAAGMDLLVIGDCKRGDVGHTTELYAQSQLGNPDFEDLEDMVAPDAVTVHGYMGLDGIKPFLHIARREAKGVFALVSTSNESAAEVQGFEGRDGFTLAEHMAQLVNLWAGDDGLVGRRGYSSLGAVVAARSVEQTQRFRGMMSKSLFLVPGYGAQATPIEHIRHCFKSDGTGAIVSNSRGVIYAFDQDRYRDQFPGDWEKCVEAACRDFATEIAQAVGM